MKNRVSRNLVVTAGVKAQMDVDQNFVQEVYGALNAFSVGSWGDLCEEDKELNDLADMYGDGRLLGAYITSRGKIWVITEWDRSATTVLFPSEY